VTKFSPIQLDGYQLGAGELLDDCLDSQSKWINPSDSLTAGVVQHRRTLIVEGLDPWELDAFYIAQANVSPDLCQSLVSPKFSGKCEQAYLLSVLFDTGTGATWSHGIHGLFSDGEQRYIVPLKHWHHWFSEAKDWPGALKEALSFIQAQ